MKTAAIDTHSHFFPREWEDLEKRFGGGDWPWMKHLGEGTAMVMVGQKEFRPVYSACWDAEKRLEEMDRDGIDLQVMCSTPVLFAYGRPVEQALYCAQIFNDAIANSTALYEYRPRTLDYMTAWFDGKRKGNYPVIGATDTDYQLLGFASYGPFRPHPAYKYTVEHSVYVAPASRGRGVGRLRYRRHRRRS